PTPGLISTFTPIPGSGVIISLYKIAASTSYCSTGNLVTYAANSGRCVVSNNEYFSFIFKYSRWERTACLIKKACVYIVCLLQYALIIGSIILICIPFTIFVQFICTLLYIDY